MRILRIEKGTTVDGPGFRTSIYIAGCRHQCPGCHNPSSWDFNAGEEMGLDELMDIIKEEEFDVTLTGGDPLYHPDEVTELTALIKEAGFSTWIYTGFTIEEIMADPTLMNVIKNCEAIVEGRFIEKLCDPDLLFRGSSNQRIIYTSTLF
ncbi:MAG: anaerobic ribonucleoside-triphosphate reductase activating protein [Bacteroides sp.]|nr:anaerobic ribonucleoside-triphosphate reductase activating protein [Bacteroides sp.]MBD5347811.1 anaerobic ribonucleoside-triphosphate reductase activating protein [Bacteroides sp.]